MQHTNMIEITTKYKSQKIKIYKLKPISNYTQQIDIKIFNKKIILPNSVKNIIHDKNSIFCLNVVTNNITHSTSVLNKNTNINKIIKIKIQSEINFKFILNVLNIHSLTVNCLNLKNISKFEYIHYLNIYTNSVKNKQKSLLYVKNNHTIILCICTFKNIIFIFKNIYTLRISCCTSLYTKYNAYNACNVCNVYNLYVVESKMFIVKSFKNIYTMYICLYDNNTSHYIQHLKNICVIISIDYKHFGYNCEPKQYNLFALSTVCYLNIRSNFYQYCKNITNIRYTNLFLFKNMTWIE